MKLDAARHSGPAVLWVILGEVEEYTPTEKQDDNAASRHDLP